MIYHKTKPNYKNLRSYQLNFNCIWKVSILIKKCKVANKLANNKAVWILPVFICAMFLIENHLVHGKWNLISFWHWDFDQVMCRHWRKHLLSVNSLLIDVERFGTNSLAFVLDWNRSRMNHSHFSWSLCLLNIWILDSMNR